MTSSTRIRFGALTAAAAVVAGGFFAAAPANAATGTIALAQTTYTAGDWGTGLDVTGTGFTADSAVTITLTSSEKGSLDTHAVTAGADGAFDETYVPSVVMTAPAAGETFSVTATSDKGDTSNTVDLTINAALAPKGIRTSVSTISTADLANKEVGFDLYAAGYQPGENVKVTATFNGVPIIGSLTAPAEEDGSIAVTKIHLTGLVQSGSLVFTVTGETSGVSQSATVAVTGETISTGGSTAPTVSGSAPAPAKRTLPVVSG